MDHNLDYNSTNNAYDLSLFEPRQQYVRAESGSVRTGSAAKKSRSRTRSKTKTPQRDMAEKERRAAREARGRLARILACGIAAFIAVAMLISSRVEFHELTLEIDKADKQLVLLEQDYEALRVTFDNKMSDTAVEEYAMSELHMQRRENSQTEYISLGVGDIFEIDDERSLDWYQSSLQKMLSYDE